MKLLRNFPRLEKLGLWRANVTAKCVIWLKGLHSLKRGRGGDMLHSKVGHHVQDGDEERAVARMMGADRWREESGGPRKEKKRMGLMGNRKARMGGQHVVNGACGAACMDAVEALAAKDAAEAVPELSMVDEVVHAFSNILRRSGVKYQKFQNQQQVFCKTNLEAQGIFDARWLSRGEALERLLDVLPTAIVLLKEYRQDLYEVVTSFKFHWLLRFLVDVLSELNTLNFRFQQRKIDITLVGRLVEQTRMRLKARYNSSPQGHQFGSGERMRLPEFIKKHQSKEKREMKAEGVDGEGNPVTFKFDLHERDSEGKETPGLVAACYELSLKFVRVVDEELEWRYRDFKNLEGAKLFDTASYLPDDDKRLAAFKRWLQQLHKLYHDALPGFNYSKARAELWMFTSTMFSQHHNEDFHQALANMLRGDSWQRSFPNIMLSGKQ
ncbi:unnamed protein product [Closterium sp. Naga37s-1]|nr:unnamed protein product [Closterium sp. Naga37s-1]